MKLFFLSLLSNLVTSLLQSLSALFQRLIMAF